MRVRVCRRAPGCPTRRWSSRWRGPAAARAAARALHSAALRAARRRGGLLHLLERLARDLVHVVGGGGVRLGDEGLLANVVPARIHAEVDVALGRGLFPHGGGTGLVVVRRGADVTVVRDAERRVERVELRNGTVAQLYWS
eukprot:6212798-Pleurochrysis_carterae.AAC.6